jgi:hypothetical protein
MNPTTTIAAKPKAKVIGQNGNVFNTLAICTTALKRVGLNEQASTMTNRVFQSGSYDEALVIMMEYIEFV